MKIQLIIVGVILVAGVVLFSSDIQNMLPNSVETTTTSLKNDVTKLSSQTFESIEKGIEHSSNVVGNVDSPINALESSKDTISKKIAEIKPINTAIP